MLLLESKGWFSPTWRSIVSRVSSVTTTPRQSNGAEPSGNAPAESGMRPWYSRKSNKSTAWLCRFAFSPKYAANSSNVMKPATRPVLFFCSPTSSFTSLKSKGNKSPATSRSKIQRSKLVTRSHADQCVLNGHNSCTPIPLARSSSRCPAAPMAQTASAPRKASGGNDFSVTAARRGYFRSSAQNMPASAQAISAEPARECSTVR